MKLLQTQDYLLLIDEEAEIKGSPFLCYNPLKITWDDDVVLYQGAMPEYNYRGLQKIIAYHPLTKEAKELDLPLLPPFEEVDIERLAKINSEYLADWQDKEFYITSFIEGYKAAQSKQFSLEDMKDALNQLADKAEYGISNFSREEVITKIIQSLSTQRVPKEFIPEYDLMNEGYDKPEDYPYQECKVLKTITNSSWKVELVGTYQY